MNNQPVLKLDLGQVADVYLDRIKALLQRGVTDEEALLQVLRKLAVDVSRARSLTLDALSNVHMYEKTEDDGTQTGLIPTLREKLARYIEEGTRDFSEQAQLLALTKLNTAQRRRLEELKGELVKDAANVNGVQQDISTYEKLLSQWQERYDERLATLKRLQGDFDLLRREGPTLIAQIKDAQHAEQAREEDRQRDLGVGDDVTTMLDDLREQAAAAARREDAGAELDAELAGVQSLDEELEDRERDEALTATIEMFRHKAEGN